MDYTNGKILVTTTLFTDKQGFVQQFNINENISLLLLIETPLMSHIRHLS